MEFSSHQDEEKDWTELVPDMLNLVSKKLSELSDIVRFRAVCKPWRSATPTNDPPSYLPWLISHSSSKSDKELCFYSLSSEKFHTIHVDNSYGKELMGPAQNYIFSTDSKFSSPAFLNPLTRKHISLLPVNLDWCFPISNDTEIVALCGGNIFSDYQTLCFCRPGDEKWTQIQKSLEGCLMIYFEGTYFVYNPVKGETEIIDVMTGDVLSKIPAPPNELNYLVESFGEILGVSCISEHHCEIYRVGRVDKTPCWVKMSGIGDRTLFLHGGQGFSIMAHESNQFEGNCVYHLGHHAAVNVDGTCTTYHLFRYKIEGKSWENIALPLMEKPTFFLPGLH